MPIDSFKPPYNWLSNFYKVDITIDNITYPTIEHAFQAAKTDNTEDKIRIASTANPVVAKRLGKKVQLIDDWDNVRLEVMRELIDIKFKNDDLATKLIATGDEIIIEGNRWHDNFWGACSCNKCSDKIKHNRLGKLLMDKRDQLRKQ